MGEPLKATHIILTPYDADGIPDHGNAYVMPFKNWTSLDFAQEEQLFMDGLAVLADLPKVVLEQTFHMTWSQFWAYLEWVGGPELVQEIKQDQAALCVWGDEGGYCP